MPMTISMDNNAQLFWKPSDFIDDVRAGGLSDAYVVRVNGNIYSLLAGKGNKKNIIDVIWSIENFNVITMHRDQKEVADAFSYVFDKPPLCKYIHDGSPFRMANVKASVAKKNVPTPG